MVLCQEVVVDEEQLNVIVGPWGYRARVSKMEYGGLGLATVFRTEIEADIEVIGVEGGRIQEVYIQQLVLLNVYGPSGNSSTLSMRKFFGENLFNIIRGGMIPIMGGDWNCVILEKYAEVNFADKRCPVLKELIREKGFVDAWDNKHPMEEGYTFERPGVSRVRLDRWYLPNEMAEGIVKVETI